MKNRECGLGSRWCRMIEEPSSTREESFPGTVGTWGWWIRETPVIYEGLGICLYFLRYQLFCSASWNYFNPQWGWKGSDFGRVDKVFEAQNPSPPEAMLNANKPNIWKIFLCILTNSGGFVDIWSSSIFEYSTLRWVHIAMNTLTSIRIDGQWLASIAVLGQY